MNATVKLNATVKSKSAETAAFLPWRGVIAHYRDWLPPVPDGAAVITPGRGRDAAAAGAGAVRADRLRRLPQGRGGQSDRLVQGPRDDDGAEHGRRPGCYGGDLCVHREHQRQRGRLRGAGRAVLRRPGAPRQDRTGQAGPGPGARRPAAPGGRQLRRLPGTGQQTGRRLPGRPGQLGEPGPARRARRRRRSRSSTRSATPRTCTACRSATRATSPPTGWATASTRRAAGRRRAPRMFGFQASGAAPIVARRAGPAPPTIATAIRIGNPASWRLAEAARDESGGLIDSVTDRQILAAYRLLAARKRYSASWPPPPGWPGCSRPRERASSPPAPGWSARSPATG